MAGDEKGGTMYSVWEVSISRSAVCVCCSLVLYMLRRSSLRVFGCEWKRNMEAGLVVSGWWMASLYVRRGVEIEL